MNRLEKLHARFGPWLALATGIATAALFQRGANFAPIAAASIIVGWGIAVVVARWLPERDGESSVRRLVRRGAIGFAAGLYQDALFFAVPIWFGSASISSVNLACPLFIALCAVFTCFDDLYRRSVLDHPFRRAMWSSMVLFSSVTPALPVLLDVPVRWAFAGSALICGLIAWLATVHWRTLLRPKVLGAALASSVAFGWFVYLIAAYMPPVPVRVVGAQIALDVKDKEPVSVAQTFDAPGRVYAWFAISAPRAYQQAIVVRWYRDGEARGRPYEASIVGGRKGGFRTWAYVSRPKPGRWRVDLLTQSDQLIARRTFSIGP